MRSDPDAQPESLRVLCIDGGGIKGYTALLILRRILRTIAAEGQLSTLPRPCDIFDLIAGTSTGGLIAVMLGRLHMTVDECIEVYEQLGKDVFGRPVIGGQFGRIIKGIASSPFYDIKNLQEQIRKVVTEKKMSVDEPFREFGLPKCKVILCATRISTSKADILRNYESLHPTAENYDCRIWEAASATAAAPIYFKSVQFGSTGERWCDGALRRNNPINEALAELSREPEWENKKIGCILSLGTGLARSKAISTNLASFIKGSLKMMTDAEDTAKVFAASAIGRTLIHTQRYFRFNVPQGMEDLQLDEWRATERMKALATDYLSDVTSGDQISQCARTLLYPDENLQLASKSKVSLIPHLPCTHFVKRTQYDERLRAFFTPQMKFRQIFALVGLGGVGLTNFIADYIQLSGLIDPASTGQLGTNSNTETSSLLEKIRNKLEETSGDWLLILDNADHLDEFLGTSGSEKNADGPSISKYIPRRGRILITTRDRRFQGSVAAANHGVCVELMTEAEATDLLLQSVPSHLIPHSVVNKLMAKDLVDELGYLPLAIAQAAANIVDQQLSFAEYVGLFREKKRRTFLMASAVHDFANTDPRNGVSSVSITWKISIDVLKTQSPLSLTFLQYLCCFHWRGIPQILLRVLPQFRDLDDAQFLHIVKRSLRLSLIEQTQEDDPRLTEYSLHPLLHEIMTEELSTRQIENLLQPLLNIMSHFFPTVPIKGAETWPIATALAPHLAQQLQLCRPIGLKSEATALLSYSLSLVHAEADIVDSAADLAEDGLATAVECLGSDHRIIIYLRTNVIARLNTAARYEKAEVECSIALKLLAESTESGASANAPAISKQKVDLLTSLAVALRGQNRYDKLEEIHREQLLCQQIAPWSAKDVLHQHNLARELLRNNKKAEAKEVNDKLLKYCETESGIRVVGERLHLVMLNLKILIMRSSENVQRYEDEIIELYARVLHMTMVNFGIRDLDSWKSLNNRVGSLIHYSRMDEVGDVLWDAVPAAITARVKAEGMFAVTMHDVYQSAVMYLHYLSNDVVSGSIFTIQEFRELLETWKYVSRVEEPPNGSPRWLDNANSSAVHLQLQGLYDEAEIRHREVIARLKDGKDDELNKLSHYNCMLAIARSGRTVEAEAFRVEHAELISPMEAIYGSLEKRQEEMEWDNKLYAEAQTLIATGELRQQNQWWLDNRAAIRRAERRYGRLQVPEQQPLPETISKHNEVGENENKSSPSESYPRQNFLRLAARRYIGYGKP